MANVVVIEGADATGKTTVAEHVAREMGAIDIEFPSPRGEVTHGLIRAMLSGKVFVDGYDFAMESLTRAESVVLQSLFVTNRYEVNEQIKEGVQRRHKFVLTRHWQSAWVYGQLDGLSAEWLERVQAGLYPADCNILLKCPLQECIRRMDTRNLPREKYEVPLKQARIHKLYDDLWEKNRHLPGWHVVDADQDLPHVIQDVLNLALK